MSRDQFQCRRKSWLKLVIEKKPRRRRVGVRKDLILKASCKAVNKDYNYASMVNVHFSDFW